MSAFKVIKTSWLRRRFIVSDVLDSIENWTDTSQLLNQEILTASTFHSVGDKIHLMVDSLTKKVRVSIEVLGIPKEGLQILDVGPSVVLVYECPETLFNVDFLTLQERAGVFMATVAEDLRPEYHIVVEGQNLALHFFIQKDYIQSTKA